MKKASLRPTRRREVTSDRAGIGHNKPPEPIRLAVMGSRTFRNHRLMAASLSEYVGLVVLAISGGADGADSLGIRWARKHGIEPPEMLPDHQRYKHVYHHRNRLVAEACTLLVAFWGGHSTGPK